MASAMMDNLLRAVMAFLCALGAHYLARRFRRRTPRPYWFWYTTSALMFIIVASLLEMAVQITVALSIRIPPSYDESAGFGMIASVLMLLVLQILQARRG